MSVTAAVTLEEAMAHLAAVAGPEHTHLLQDAIFVAPAGTQQIAEVLRFANANGLVVTPTGGGAKMGWGNPVAPRILLSTGRMNSLREHSWQDMTCTVEAGCSWAAMQAGLARHGQMVALDPLWPERATVGGVVATNDGGAMRLRYGPLRDLIIGMTIVLADGTVAKSGGKVVKNVAGYDLHKLMIGSFGTLAVIADVNFRLHPVEEHARTWSAQAADAARLEAPLNALLDSQIVPSCVQMRTSNRECVVDIRIAAVPECLDQHALDLERIFDGIPLGESSHAVWQARQNLFDRAGAVILKVALLPGEICAVTAEMQRWAAAGDVEISVVAQASGLVTVALGAVTDAVIAFVDRLRKRLRASGGSVVALHLPDAMRGRLDVWGCESSALPLMREIKHRFDPHRILNPGRFVGSI